jgi:hypothetical protein
LESFKNFWKAAKASGRDPEELQKLPQSSSLKPSNKANFPPYSNSGDHARQDSMEAWSKHGITDIPLPPPLER